MFAFSWLQTVFKLQSMHDNISPLTDRVGAVALISLCRIMSWKGVNHQAGWGHRHRGPKNTLLFRWKGLKRSRGGVLLTKSAAAVNCFDLAVTLPLTSVWLQFLFPAASLFRNLKASVIQQNSLWKLCQRNKNTTFCFSVLWDAIQVAQISVYSHEFSYG